MKKEDESPNNAILHCQKKLQRIRAFIYILILIAIVRIAMMDFNGVSTRMCIDVAVMLFIIGLTLVCEKYARRKLKQAIRHAEEEEERC